MKKNLKKCMISIFLSFFVLSIVAITINIVNKKDNKEDEVLEMLNQYDGMYDTNSIVLNNTNKEVATELANRLNATLRMNSYENYATLTLPENVLVKELQFSRKK